MDTKERLVIMRRLKQADFSHGRIGQLFGISRQRVSQILAARDTRKAGPRKIQWPVLRSPTWWAENRHRSNSGIAAELGCHASNVAYWRAKIMEALAESAETRRAQAPISSIE